jgi:cardiolipin synthase A/B
MPDLIAWIFGSREATITFIFGLNAIFIAFVILLENREPERTLTWLFVLFTFPIIGFVLYLFFGHDWHRRRSHARLRAAYEITKAWKTLAESSEKESGTAFEADLRRLAVSTTGFPATCGNRVAVLTDACVKYPRLIAMLKTAQTSIDCEYFIFRNDDIGREIISVLKERARAGVRVRFIVDGYGSFGFGFSAFREMHAAGIQARYFAPLITTFSFFKANFRDHRKIVVVDGKVAFTGGINIGNEYLGKSKIGPWRDTSIEIRGPAVAQLATLFEDAWRRTTSIASAVGIDTPQPPSPDALAPMDIGVRDGEAGDECINVIPSGPTTDWYAIHEIYLALIHGAKRSIYIESPYFIPDASILDGLVNAALRGVDVKIIAPRHTDNPMLRWVAVTYLGEVVRAGGHAYEYPLGFLHKKIVIADNEVATMGTCNIDIRSFLLDFEVNVLLSHPATIGHLLEDFNADLRDSNEMTFEQFLDRPFLRRLKESLARLVAPLL